MLKRPLSLPPGSTNADNKHDFVSLPFRKRSEIEWRIAEGPETAGIRCGDGTGNKFSADTRAEVSALDLCAPLCARRYTCCLLNSI